MSRRHEQAASAPLVSAALATCRPGSIGLLHALSGLRCRVLRLAHALIELFLLREVEPQHCMQAIQEPPDIRQVMRIGSRSGQITKEEVEQPCQMKDLLMGPAEGP